MINISILSLFLMLIITCGSVFLLIQLIRVSFYVIDALKIYIEKNRVVKKIPPQESLAQNPNFPRNASGEAYGSCIGVSPYEKEPDLVKAMGVDGTIGYVRQTETDGEMPKNPEEALAQQVKQTVRYVNLYESDGKTIIGKFKISPGRSVMKDENGKIIEPFK
jgi:hypothetical protein